MANAFGSIFVLALLIVGALLALKIAVGVFLILLHILIPALVLATVVYVVIRLTGPKSLSGRNRSIL